MNEEVSDEEIARQLTGFCPYLVQGAPFKEGDSVEIGFKRSDAVEGDVEWVPLSVTRPTATRETLRRDEREWGSDVVLVKARLSRTGGSPRDSMNQPVEYDPDAVTLSDVRVVDRSPPRDGFSG